MIADETIKAALKNRTVIIGICGPYGAGKDYMAQKAIEYFHSMSVPAQSVTMTTDRPSRGETETKRCVSPEEYDNLESQGKLLGHHGKYVHYGYHIDDLRASVDAFKKTGGALILEVSSNLQKDLPAELYTTFGLRLTAWIGIIATPEQTRLNMEDRGEDPEIITRRQASMQWILDSIYENPHIAICDNGPDNRHNSAVDFINIIKKAIIAT